MGCRNWRGIQGARYSSAELMHLGHTAGLMPLLPVGGVEAAGWGHWLPLEAVHSRRSSQFSDRSGLHQRAGRHEVEVAETEQFLQDTGADIASWHHTFTGAHRSRWFWSWCS